MTRIDDDMDWVELHRTALQMGKPVIYRAARCQHGKTQDQTCRDCEGGYVDDTHTFARIGSYLRMHDGRQCAAVSDDGADVGYIPAHKQSSD